MKVERADSGIELVTWMFMTIFSALHPEKVRENQGCSVSALLVKREAGHEVSGNVDLWEADFWNFKNVDMVLESYHG
jgi:hypothetical protein